MSLGNNSIISGVYQRGNLNIGKNCIIKDTFFEGLIEIGDYTTLWGPNISLYGNISIGSYCSIASNVSFFELNHNYKKLTTYFIFKNFFKEEIKEQISKGKIQIGSDVWIGSGVKILSGSLIDNGVVVAANSVVNSYLPPYSICSGSPAKVLKYRFEEDVISRLLELKWWDWSEDKIKKNKKLFFDEISLKELINIK